LHRHGYLTLAQRSEKVALIDATAVVPACDIGVLKMMLAASICHAMAN
jgi:hypothetical protein